MSTLDPVPVDLVYTGIMFQSLHMYEFIFCVILAVNILNHQLTNKDPMP